MRKVLPVLVLAVAAASGTSCASLKNVDAGEIVADISEFLGRSDPSRHIGRLVEIHDTASFHHVPDTPPSYDLCLEEVRVLSRCGYETWREVGLATFFVTRVCGEDQAALNRGEAARALVRLGGMVLDAEDPPGPDAEASEKEVGDAIGRLAAIHDPAGHHVPPGPEIEAECARLVRRLGDLRYRDSRPPTESEIRYRLKILRGILNIVITRGLADEDRGRDAQAGVDRALINIAAQAVRLSLTAGALHDPNATVRAAAATALGRLRDASSAASLSTGYARERDDAVRREIVRALGAVAAARAGPGRDAAVPALIAALADDDRSVRFNARQGLRDVAGEDLGEESGPWMEWWNRVRSGS